MGHGLDATPKRWAQEYDASPETVAAVRRLARTALTERGTTAPPDLELVVSELAANAVRHARTRYQVTIEVGADAVVVEVHDESRALPERRDPRPTDGGGRGLMIVEALSRRWGVRPVAGDGKTVWAELALPG